jgi:regulatory protein
MQTQDRAARLAELAAQISAVEGGRAGVQSSSARQSVETDAGPVDAVVGSADKDQIVAAKAICLRLLAVAPRPRAGLAQAMKRKDVPDHVAEAVLDRLTEVGLVDDVAYAQSFVRVKQRDRALGRTALRTELRKLGVDEEVTVVAVDAVDEDAERARASDLVAKRVDAAMAAGPVAARRRLLGLLSRRGYSFEVAVPVVEEALHGYSDGAESAV